MGDLSVLKRAEFQSVKIPGLDDFAPQKTTTMSREFVPTMEETLGRVYRQ
jgi:hypothetical protein